MDRITTNLGLYNVSVTCLVTMCLKTQFWEALPFLDVIAAAWDAGMHASLNVHLSRKIRIFLLQNVFQLLQNAHSQLRAYQRKKGKYYHCVYLFKLQISNKKSDTMLYLQIRSRHRGIIKHMLKSFQLQTLHHKN